MKPVKRYIALINSAVEMKMPNELKENATPHTLCMPLCGYDRLYICSKPVA